MDEQKKRAGNQLAGFLALVAVIFAAIAVILAVRALSPGVTAPEQSGMTLKEISLPAGGDEAVIAAWEILEGKELAGYRVNTSTKGYQSLIMVQTDFDRLGEQITTLKVLEQGETDGVGSQVAAEAFTSQFSGIAAPVALRGDTASQPPVDTSSLADGSYEARKEEYDANGFQGYVNRAVQDDRGRPHLGGTVPGIGCLCHCAPVHPGD